MIAARTHCPREQVKVVSSSSGFLDEAYEVEACGKHLTIRCAGTDMECGGF